MTFTHHRQHHRQQGAALVIGLILLLIMTLLGVSGMNTASLELMMTSNEQVSENAFQASEVGIERVLSTGGFTTTGAPVVTTGAVGTGDGFEATTSFEIQTAVPPRVGSAFSRGVAGGGFAAYHFEIMSRGTSQRNALEQHTQGLYIIGPGGGTRF
jgi:type IV pilus assembly protein PilX